MHWETLYPETRSLLEKFLSWKTLAPFRLVGGTALALQIGHRKSIDLDFFTTETVNYDRLLESLNEAFGVEVVQHWKTGLILNIEGVKCDLLRHQYPWLESPVELKGMQMAGKQDIAAMKVNAICGRGSKKDFFDLYFLLQQYSLEEIIRWFEVKYSNYSKLMVYKSLVYFEDAEEEPDPDMIENLSWQKVKKEIIKRCENLKL